MSYAGTSRSRRRLVVGLLLVGLALSWLAGAPHGIPKVGVSPAGAALTGIHKIQHVVVLMQENRSFDSYFGTYPGADGIQMSNGLPTECVPNPATGGCDRPYVNHADDQGGGPHGEHAAVQAVDGGKMDGFVATAESAQQGCVDPNNPQCANGPMDVMGYHTRGDIPNYWTYAQRFVLQDHMFEPNASWSLPSHLFGVSEWAAVCTSHDTPNSCTNSLSVVPPYPPTDWTKYPAGSQVAPIYAWTDLTYLLHKNGVSWGYYVATGTEPDCEDDQALTCDPVPQNALTPGIWNPLPYFDTVVNDGQLGNIQSVANFYSAAATGTLPAVSWVIPSNASSEHPPSSTSAGQTFVTSAVNAIMRGPDWNSTAIFVSWDDWGGFYDHVVPPTVDQNGYGLRVPGLVISPYAKRGYIDKQTLSFDAYVKFIEDDFLNGQRLDPNTDGRPDPRPDVRENATILGSLTSDFDFNQMPRPPLVLDEHPATTLTIVKPFPAVSPQAVPGDGQVVLRWKRPHSDGGSPITGYRVFPFVDGRARTARTFTSPATSQTIGNLINGRSYTFQISAISAKGVGMRSAQTLPVTVGTPTAPSSSVAVPADGAASVSWTAPAENGDPVTAYTVTAYINGVPSSSQSFDPATTTVTMTGLRNGAVRTFTVAATNARGKGPESLPTTKIIIGAPTGPTAVTATAGAARATVHWNAPSDNNSPITGYTVTPYLGPAAQPARTFTSNATTQTLTGLVPETAYTFTVTAVNARGTGPKSAASNPVYPTYNIQTGESAKRLRAY